MRQGSVCKLVIAIVIGGLLSCKEDAVAVEATPEPTGPRPAEPDVKPAKAVDTQAVTPAPVEKETPAAAAPTGSWCDGEGGAAKTNPVALRRDGSGLLVHQSRIGCCAKRMDEDETCLIRLVEQGPTGKIHAIHNIITDDDHRTLATLDELLTRRKNRWLSAKAELDGKFNLERKIAEAIVPTEGENHYSRWDLPGRESFVEFQMGDWDEEVMGPIYSLTWVLRGKRKTLDQGASSTANDLPYVVPTVYWSNEPRALLLCYLQSVVDPDVGPCRLHAEP